jgi:hypothetical protein
LSCVPSVACFSVVVLVVFLVCLSLSFVLCTQCCLFLCSCSCCVLKTKTNKPRTQQEQLQRNRQHWVHKTKDKQNKTRTQQEQIQRNRQHWVHKTKDKQCYQCLWIVFVLSLVYPMLPVSLNCHRPVSCVPNVTSVSELSSSCLLSETLVTLGTQETGRWQFRDIGNIGYTRDRTMTIQRHW